MSIISLSDTPPASPALSSSSFSTTFSASRPKTLYRKPVPTAALDAAPPSFAFNFTFSAPASPDAGPFTPDAANLLGSPASFIQHLSLDSPCRARDLSSPEMHDTPSSDDGYSSDEEIRRGAGPVCDGGMFGTRLVRDDRYANPARAELKPSLGEPSKGRIINDPQAVQHLFGASLQRSRRTSPVEEVFPADVHDPTETLVDEAQEPDFRLALAEHAPESSSMAKSGSGSSAASVASARTGKVLKARRAAAAKAAWKDEFADMAAEERVVHSTEDDDPEAFVFEQPSPEPTKEDRKKLPRSAPRRRDDSSDVFSLDSPSDGVSPAAGDDDKKKRKHFNLHLSLPGSNHSSRPSSPISLASIGSPAALSADSPYAMVRGVSSPSALLGSPSSLAAPALAHTQSLNSKLASGYNVSGPPLDLASAHMLFQESIPRICTPEPVSEAEGASNGGHRAFDFLHSKPEVKAPAYRTRHKHSNSTPGFGLRELREMRQAADLIERDARRPAHSRSPSFAEKKLKRKPVPKMAGEHDRDDELEVHVDTTKASGGYFNPTFSFPMAPGASEPSQTVVLSVDQHPESSSESARTSSDSFESSAFPRTPAYLPEFGMLAPAGTTGRRRSVSLSDMDAVAPFSTASIPIITPPPPFRPHADDNDEHLTRAFERVAVGSPHPIAFDPATTPQASHTSFFDAVSASHAKIRHHRAPSFSHSPPVPAIPSPDEREVTGAWKPYSERRVGEAGSPTNPYGLQGKKGFGSMRRKTGRSSPRD